MQITTAAIFLFAAMGVVATPVEPNSNSLNVRGDGDGLITYEGKCDKEKNECKYKNDKGHDTFIKCPKFANKKCTKDGAKCEYDSADKSVVCY